MKKLIFAFVTIALAGCGGDDAVDAVDAADAAALDAPLVGEELLGVWQIVSHLRDEDGCDERVALGVPAYIEFIAGQIAGRRYVEWVACTDAAGLACDAPGTNFLYYAEPIDGGARAVIYIASGEPSDCTLGATISDAIVAGDNVIIETRSSQLSGITDTACTTDDAMARAATMPCTQFDRMLGARP